MCDHPEFAWQTKLSLTEWRKEIKTIKPSNEQIQGNTHQIKQG